MAPWRRSEIQHRTTAAYPLTRRSIAPATKQPSRCAVTSNASRATPALETLLYLSLRTFCLFLFPDSLLFSKPHFTYEFRLAVAFRDTGLGSGSDSAGLTAVSVVQSSSPARSPRCVARCAADNIISREKRRKRTCAFATLPRMHQHCQILCWLQPHSSTFNSGG